MSRPAYQYLSREELRERVRRALASLEECRACPRDCGVNRLEDKWAACKTGRYALVGSYFPHFGEEDCLRGWNGSGTIFFSHCNLRCVFCTVPGTRVTTSEGLLPIEEIFARGRETDREEVRLLDGKVRVLTREGRWAPVAKAFRHRHAGEMIRLKPYCCPPLLLTPNHRLFAVRKADPSRLLEVPAGALTREHRVVVPARRPAREEVDLGVPEILESVQSPLGYLLPIHKFERVPYDGPVFNLEVDDREHSYLAPFVAVANCQNWEISQAIKPHASPPGSRPEEIAAMMLELQGRGCHNINFVTPEHVVPQVVEAVALAVEGGLRLPIVYNTSAYDALESLELMDGIVDIYMPDFKYWSEERSRTYMKAADYPEAARAAMKEMHRQVGNLVVDADGMARRGLILRHLVMPGFLDETREILRWVAEELGPDTYVNLMDQYYPAGAVGEDRYPEIDRRLSPEEFEKARAMARELGLRRLDARRPHPRLLRRRLAVLWE